MDSYAVDPRTSTREDFRPTYRVYFWGEAMSSYEFKLTGASGVDEVLRWAEDNREGRTYTVYVVAKGDNGQVGIVRLLGEDPTRRE